MKAIVRKQKDRSYQGRSPIFRVRGQPIEYRDVVRYWKRKQMSIDDVLALCNSRKATPEALECTTPVPSTISTPAVLSEPERLLKTISDYCKGSFESGTWYSIDPTLPCASSKATTNSDLCLDLITDQMYHACALFDRGECWEAGRALKSAFTVVKGILIAEHPMNLTYIIRMVAELQRRRRPEILMALLRHCTDMGERVLCQGHPIPQITALFSRQNVCLQQIFIDGAHKSIMDNFKHQLGSAHWATMEMPLYFTSTEAGNLSAIQTIRNDIPRYEELLGFQDHRCVMLHLRLAALFVEAGQYAEAEMQALYFIQVRQKTSTGTYDYADALGSGYLSLARFAQHRTDDGETDDRYPLGPMMSYDADFHTTVQRWMMILEAQLKSAGRIESAIKSEQLKKAIKADALGQEDASMPQVG